MNPPDFLQKVTKESPSRAGQEKGMAPTPVDAELRLMEAMLVLLGPGEREKVEFTRVKLREMMSFDPMVSIAIGITAVECRRDAFRKLQALEARL